MALFRALICGAALAIALTPLAALAADTSPQHMQDELTNAQAQFALAQQQANDLQQQAIQNAANERMMARLQSEAMRQRQLNVVTNATALEQIAGALANAARAQGEANAQNELAIAQLKANVLVSTIEAKVANATMLAALNGRDDELANAQAQASFLHQLADFISGKQAELNMSNARAIGEQQADSIHTPAIAQQQNGQALGANALLAADTALAAGELNASAVIAASNAKAQAIVAAAAARLENARVRAGAK